MKISVPVFDQSHLQARGFFYVGGHYCGAPGSTFMDGQMFVEVYVPKKIKHPYPVIMFHGAGQTNLNWLGTPDGRKGWTDYFVELGYVVYLAEQPARGRSAYHPEMDGVRRYHPIEDIASRFVGSDGQWTSAHLHTQWPEEGLTPGSEIFDQFAAQQVEYLASNKKSQEMVLADAKALLEKTGPAILLTHSQAGPFGWLIADACPESVKGIVALEPGGPPFSPKLSEPKSINFGLADLNMHFVPPVSDPGGFKLTRMEPDQSGRVPGWIMDANCRFTLPNLAGLPILMVTAEASYHAQYDYLTSYVMEQMGIHHDHVELNQVGIHGNSHFMMMEKNNLEIADFIDKWLTEHHL